MSTKGSAGKVIIALLVLGLVAALIIWIRGEEERHAIKVAVMTWAGAGPGYVGMEKGFFDGLDVELRVIDDTKARQAAFSGEDFEVYLTNPDQHPKEHLQELPGTMILLSDVSYGADGVLAAPSISSIGDLKGKSIAYTQGTASDYMLSKALESAELSREDVVLKTLDDPGTAVAALASGQVEAAVSWEPLMTQAVKEGKGRILFTSRDIPDGIMGVFVAKDSLVEDKPRLQRFLDGWLRSVEFVKGNPEESYPIMAKGLAVSESEIIGMMDGLRLADRKKNVEMFLPRDGKPSKLEEFTNKAAAYWQRVGLLPRPVPANKQWIRKEIVEYYTSLSRP